MARVLPISYRHAIVNHEKKVVNVVVWEGTEWLPPRDHMVINCADGQCDIGDIYDEATNTFTKVI